MVDTVTGPFYVPASPILAALGFLCEQLWLESQQFLNLGHKNKKNH
jgi:hypothetical protein